MVFPRPRSIFQLTVTGFFLVTAILVFALLTTVNQLNGLSERSRSIISRSARAMESNSILITQSAALERNALQYRVVENPEILEVYADRRERLEKAAQQLVSLELSSDIARLINQLVSAEARAYESMRNLDGNANEDLVFPGLLEATYRISDAVSQWTGDQLSAIEEETAQTRNLLQTQIILMISMALILAGIFTALITRPLMQIKQGINQLGSGLYDSAISVHGPKDLADLGNLLEWLRNRLDKLEKLRTSFLRHVSHELKTPLAAMQESSSLLSEELVGTLNDDQREILRIQGKNCQSLQKLIDNLLQFNSESFSVLNAMPLPVKLDKVVNDLVAAHELTIRQAGIVPELELQQVSVKGNPEQIRVIIDNLLTNAIKYSPNGGTVRIKLYASCNEAILEVIDQGPGIPEHERNRIFDAFYQATPPLRGIKQSTGLGLAIAREYAHANGGKIRVLNNTSGAHFQLVFPALIQEPV